MAERSIRDLFHSVGRVLPENQQIVTISLDTEVGEALAIMKASSFNQLPVVTGIEVAGVFSYRSLAHGIEKLPKKEPFTLALPVELFLEKLDFVGLSNELTAVIDEFDFRDAVLVGSPDKLIGILTTIDALRYFYYVASPYVLLREIELAIRELINASVTPDQLIACIERSLKKHYESLHQELPTQLAQMSLSDYVTLLRFQANWQHFRGAWGGTNLTVASKLQPLPELRNAVFHFRRELSVEEYDLLRDRRDWLLQRITKVAAERMVHVTN